MTDKTPISAFVITAGTRNEKIFHATLKAISWVDEVIIINKAKDFHPLTSLALADEFEMFDKKFRYVSALWSPTVEPTRAYADSLCTHEWRICLDDDEILSSDCELVFRGFAEHPPADTLAVPIKHWILGRHDPRARYWPEYRPVLYKKGAIEYLPTTHAGTKPVKTVRGLDKDTSAYIDHLSHENISAWLEKTNRYTDQKDRSGMKAPEDVWEFVNNRLHANVFRGRKDKYLLTNDVLHALYEIIDGLKRWEETEPSGTETFDKFCDSVLARP